MSESHKESHGDEKKPIMDKLFTDLLNYITKSISTFVAFLFILITFGAIIGYMVGVRREDEWLVITPAIIGMIAYYNRAFAVAIFLIVLVFVFLLL